MEVHDQTLIELALRFTAALSLTLASGVLCALLSKHRLRPTVTWKFLLVVVFSWSIFRWGIFGFAFLDDTLDPGALAAISPWLNQISQTFAALAGFGIAVVAWGERE